ncbi:MAG: glycosyltransferase [Pyrinomonadaceae bacterium]
MRLLKIGVYHTVYLKEFYARRPGLAAESYAAQHEALIDDCFGSSDFWTRELSRLGYETCDLVINAEPLQRAWAAERGTAFDEEGWLFGITEAQVRDFRPDVLVVADYSNVTASFLRRLREVCPSIRLVLGWCGAPYSDGSVFAEWDVVLSCVPELVAHFREAGHHSRHVNHAFEPRVLDKLDARGEAPAVDFVFVGSLVKAERFHLGREKLLSRLVEATGLQIWAEVGPPPPTRLQRAARLLRGTWKSPQTSVDARIARHARPPVFGLDMFRQLRAGRVALNTHIDISIHSASNMRLFEATGVGACLLTDSKENMRELFEPDAEVVAYRDAEECVEQVKYLLGHESRRRDIAAAGQRRTLREHTFASRAALIDAAIRERLSSGRAARPRPSHR